MKTTDFNLIDQPWIPLIRKDSSSVELGLQETLCRAHEFDDLYDPSPLVSAALLRLLLAILHRAFEGPRSLEDWKAIWDKKRFDRRAVVDYLETYRGRFGLFDEKHPFYQIAGFEVDSKRPVWQLAQELAGGNNPTLFDHTLDLYPEVSSPANCARMLVANQAFALGGGKGATSKMFGKHPYLSHGPLAIGVLAFLKGNNLFETLLHNLLCYGKSLPSPELDCNAEDEPAWERTTTEKPGERTPKGWLDFLTWQSRCIRLMPGEGGVRWMSYAQGQKLKAPRPCEPMWFYEFDEENPDDFRAVRLDPGKSLWRSSHALFAFTKQQDTGRHRRPLAFDQASQLCNLGVLSRRGNLQCMLIGLASNKAKPLLWIRESLPVSSALLEDEDAVNCLRDGLRACEDAGNAVSDSLFYLAANLLVSGADGKTGRTPDRRETGKLAESLQGRLLYWSTLEVPFRQFLSRLGENPQDAMDFWLGAVRSNAFHAFDVASASSLCRGPRELCARVKAGRTLGYRLKDWGIKEVVHEAN